MEASQFKSDQYVRFCPGCGDHAICMALQKAMAQIGIPTHKIAVISGIGCSSRMPHYLNTYGFNTIHGRAGAVATGVKTSHPELTVWQMSGDGDRSPSAATISFTRFVVTWTSISVSLTTVSTV
jgi:2-oxoglutarate ferredoxin oxidoreductase subunit beta